MLKYIILIISQTQNIEQINKHQEYHNILNEIKNPKEKNYLNLNTVYLYINESKNKII